MFEYINFELLKATIFFIATAYIVLLSNSSKKQYYYLVMLLALSVIFINADMNESKSIENIKSFSQGVKLKCQIDSTLYSVSKKDAWILDKGYFIRDSLMIRADKCEEF